MSDMINDFSGDSNDSNELDTEKEDFNIDTGDQHSNNEYDLGNSLDQDEYSINEEQFNPIDSNEMREESEFIPDMESDLEESDLFDPIDNEEDKDELNFNLDMEEDIAEEED